MDINEIIKIQNLLENQSPPDFGFFYLARNDSEVKNLAMIATGVPNFVGQPAVDQLKRWMSSLDTIRRAILNSIYSQLRDLGCQQKGIDALRKQVFGK